jgi:hypothetical protein
MRNLLLLLILFLPAAEAVAQLGTSVPQLPFNTRDFFDKQGAREGEMVARLRFSYDLREDNPGLCLDFGLRPDPRSLLKGFFSFLHSTFPEMGKRQQSKIKFALAGKGVKEDGVSYWSDCVADVAEPLANDEVESLIRRPKTDMIDIQIPFPEPGLYHWVTVVRLPNGGLSWSTNVEEITDDG